MNESIQFMLTLQSYDTRALELAQKLANIPYEIERLDHEIENFEKKLLEKKEEIRSLKKIIRNGEQDLQFAENQLAKDKQRLSLTKNPQEYKIFSQKIDDSRVKIEEIEEKLMGKLLELDEENLKLEREQFLNNEAIIETRERKNEQDGICLRLKENIDEIEKKIATIRCILQKNNSILLENYDRTKKTVRKMPCVVFLKNGQYCGGCNLKLSDNFCLTSRGFSFIICENCARIILTVSEKIDDSHGDDGNINE